jgi:sulfatase modifying factor 1
LKARALVGTVAALVAACTSTPAELPPLGQILLFIDTDAPLPPAAGAAPVDFTEPAPLFDRLRVELQPPGQAGPCAGCSNDFAVDAGLFARLGASVGLQPPPGQAGWTARIRLYVARFASADGTPDAGSTIDVTVSLPPVGATGVDRWTVTLHTDDTGVPVGPVEPTAGAPDTSVVGTWPRARRVPCAGAAGPGEVCVPGGAFWMGDPGDHSAVGVAPGWHRLVVLSPFYLDAREVVAGAIRPAAAAAWGVRPWSGGSAGTDPADWCTYGVQPGPRDALPLVCITWAGASAFCHALGKALPTEAQLEYAMGALAGQRFVWGEDLPVCDDAVFGRGGFGVFSDIAHVCPTTGASLGSLGGPEPPGPGPFKALDMLPLPGGDIWDLMGNVQEWAADVYQASGEACWRRGGILQDPVCTTPGPTFGSSHSIRGGSWLAVGVALQAAARNFLAANGINPELGFRCARPGAG